MARTQLPAILRALVDSRAAWLTIPEIVYALNQSKAATRRDIKHLIADGLVDRHTLSDGRQVVTFSVSGAAALGYELIDDHELTDPGDDHFGRWVESSSLASPPPPERDDRPDRIERVVDPRPGPLERVILQEQDVGYPTVILAGTPRPWREVAVAGDRPPSTECRACRTGGKKNRVLRPRCECGRGLRKKPKRSDCPCKGLPLSKSTYCAGCHRWGWDEFFHPKRSAQGA